MIVIDDLKAYTVQEAAELLNVTAQTVRHLIKDGKLPAQKVGRPYMITETALKDYIAKR